MPLVNSAGKLNIPSRDELLAADGAAEIITFTEGMTASGEPYWAYVAVQPSKYRDYIEATSACRTIDLADFGRVIKWGHDAVPSAVREEMKRDYHYDDNYLSNLAKEAEAEFIAHNKQKEDKRLGDIVAMLKKQQ